MHVENAASKRAARRARVGLLLQGYRSPRAFGADWLAARPGKGKP